MSSIASTSPLQSTPTPQAGATHNDTPPTVPVPPQHMSDRALEAMARHESFRGETYKDSGGVPTIGYGHTGADVKTGMKISHAQGLALLRRDVATAEAAVRQLVKVPLSQGQFDALVSFAFNVGGGALKDSTLLRKLNAGDQAGAQAEFGRWVHDNGRVQGGLVRRRAEEAQWFGGAPVATPSTRGASQGHSSAPAHRPHPQDITVRSGDTLSRIAARQHITLPALLAANPQIRNANVIHAGDRLHVPGAHATDARASQAAHRHRDHHGPRAALPPQAAEGAPAASRPAANHATPNTPAATHAGRPPQAPSQAAPQASPHGATSAAATTPASGATASTPQDYARLITQHGDARARADLEAGRKVVLAIRHDTSTQANNGRGVYDDTLVVVQKMPDGRIQATAFRANTEPAGVYERRGYGSDVDGDGRKELGRLVEGTYHYQQQPGQFVGNRYYRAESNQSAQRDANHDGQFTAADPVDSRGAGRSILIHQGGNNSTGSAGCQTMSPAEYQRFMDTLGAQQGFSYVLTH